MELINAVILAIIQGVAEFLPVSSSGHLAVAQHFLPNFNQPGMAYDILLHFATLGSVVLYFRRDLIGLIKGVFTGKTDKSYELPQSPRHIALMVIVATIPVVVAGLLIRSFAAEAFKNLPFVASMFLVTATALFITKFSVRDGKKSIGTMQALLIGTAQAVAILPGISRSGFTIAAAIMLLVDKKYAAKFSFFISIPAILGAVVVEGSDIFQLLSLGTNELIVCLAGAVTAFLVGYMAIHLLLKTVVQSKFHYFAYYCFPLGVVLLATVIWGS